MNKIVKQAQEEPKKKSPCGRKKYTDSSKQICYKTNEPCNYDCKGLCRESC